MFHPSLNVLFVVIGTMILIAIFSKVKWIKITSGLISVLGLFFLFKVSTIQIGQSYHVQNERGDFEFSLVPTKGRDFEMMEGWLETYKEKEGITEEVELFRTEKINYLAISKWEDYYRNEYWDLNFINRTNIENKAVE